MTILLFTIPLMLAVIAIAVLPLGLTIAYEHRAQAEELAGRHAHGATDGVVARDRVAA